MSDSISRATASKQDDADSAVTYHKKDLWKGENANYSRPHYRLEKAARIVNRISAGKTVLLLDVGCGPAALAGLLEPNIKYYGVDIAIHAQAPNLLEVDLMESPIKFADNRFDIVIAQGFFEYAGEFQDQKFAEIAQVLREDGTFIVSYVNFGHRDKFIYELYNNVKPIAEFRASLARHFTVRKSFPTSHNWRHFEPNRKLVKAVNMHFNANVPFVSPLLVVEYFFICSRR